MINVEFVFEDSRGLMDVLRRNRNYSVCYTNEGLEKPVDSQGLWLGARVPFEDLQHIILQSLERYDHIRYYWIGTDFAELPDAFQESVLIGALTDTALHRKIRPIEPTEMTSKLRGMSSADELFDFIRERYHGDVPTCDNAGAEAGPCEPIRALEYLDDSGGSNRYALSINLIAESPDEFIETMSYVKEAYINWLAQRRDEAVLFRFAVAAAAEDHEEIDALIRKIYAEEQQLAPLLQAVDFDVTIEDPDSGVSIHYVLEGVPA